jgi:hypothetical protein
VCKTTRRASPVQEPWRRLPIHLSCANAADTAYDGRLFVCGDQSGRTSAPINPQAVQTIRGHNERTGISSGSQSAFMTTLWLHHIDSQ